MRRLEVSACAIVAVAFVAGCGSPNEAGEIDERTGEAKGAQVVCAAGPTVEGIDVSYYQGDIDWNQVAGSGRAYAVTRINDGGFMDPKFDQNWAGIKAAGMIRGAYQFFEPGEDENVQADVVIQKVGKLGPGDLPVMLDMEVTGGQSPATITAKIHTWIDKVQQATGKPPLIYTGKYFWEPNVQSGDFANLPLWIAAYVQPNCPNLPSPWSNWAFWQYNDNGQIPGIGGNTDVDMFNGDKNALDLFVGNAYAATYVSESYPMKMIAGDVADVELVLTNTGGRDWDGNTHLGTTMPRDRSSDFANADWPGPNRPAYVSGTVAPGAQFKFAFKMKAPMKPGMYTEHWDLVQEGVAWFGDQGGPPDDQVWFQIEVGEPPPTTASSSASTGSHGSTSTGYPVGSTGTGAGGSDALDPASTGVYGGCGCEAVGEDGERGGGIALAAFGLALVTRRRRHPRS